MNKTIKVVIFRFMVMLLLITAAGGQSNITATLAQRDVSVAGSSVEDKPSAGNATDKLLGKDDTSPSSPLSANAWSSLGPRPLDSGDNRTPTPGPPDPDYRYGKVAGRVNALAVPPGSSYTVYAGMAEGGVWKTTNCCSSTTTWTPMTDDPTTSSTGAIGALAIDPNAPNTIYAGTGDSKNPTIVDEDHADDIDASAASHGVLKSTDAGVSWQTWGESVFGSGTNGKPQRILVMAVDPSNNKTVLAGTDSLDPAKAGLYISKTAGQTWGAPCRVSAAPAGAKQVVSDIVLDYRTTAPATIIYVALGDPLPTTNNPANGIYKATLPRDGSCPLAWQRLISPPSGDFWGRIQLAMADRNHDILYAVMAPPSALSLGPVALYKSIDAGAHWTMQYGYGAQVFTDCNHNTDPNVQGLYNTYYALYIKVDPQTPETIYLGVTNLYKSTDSGVSYTNLTEVSSHQGPGYPYNTCPRYGSVHADQHAFAFLPSDGADTSSIVIGNDGGVYGSLNGGGNFTELNDTISTIQFYAGDVTPNFANDRYASAFGGAQDNGSAGFTGSAANWGMNLGGDGGYSAIEPNHRLNWYAEEGSNLMCSTAGVAIGSFQPCNGDWLSEQRSPNPPLVLDHHNCGATCEHLIFGSNRVWESIRNNPATGLPQWQAISNDLTCEPPATPPCSTIRALSFSPQDTAVIYAGTNNGRVFHTNNANTGSPATWVNLTNYANMPRRAVTDIAVNPPNNLFAYAVFDGYNENTPAQPGHIYQVHCSNQACTTFTWTDLSGNLPNYPVYSVAVNPLRPEQVFIGTEQGISVTNNINISPVVWQTFRPGMPVTPVFHLTIDNGNTSLVAWTFGRGAYTTSLPQATPTWQIVPTSTDGQLFGVAATSPNNAWAVGERYGVGNYAHTLTMHWDGSNWSNIPSPNLVGNNNNTLYAVATVPGTNHAWAVGNSDGNSGQAITLYWDGTSWNAIANPTGLARPELKGVTALAENNVWAVGDYQDTIPNRTLIMHWDGSTWSIVPSPNPDPEFNYLSAVSAVSANDIWTVGYSLPAGGGSYPAFTIHWNGTAWSIVPNPPLPRNFHPLYSVTAVSSNDVWAVGRWIDQYGDYTLSEHWNGITWSIVSTPNPPGSLKFLDAVWAASSGDVWAVGPALDNTTTSTLTMHWNGSSWGIVPSPNHGSGSSYLNAVAGSSSGDVWAVGYYEDASGNYRTFIIHTNG